MLFGRLIRLQHLVGSSFGCVTIGGSERADSRLRLHYGSYSSWAAGILSVVALKHVDMWRAHLAYGVIFLRMSKVAQHLRTSLLLYLRFALALIIFLKVCS